MQDDRNSLIPPSECSIYIYFNYLLLLLFYYFAKGGLLMKDQSLARPVLRSETLVVIQHFIPIFHILFFSYPCSLLLCVLLLGVSYRIIRVRYCSFSVLFINSIFTGLLWTDDSLAHTCTFFNFRILGYVNQHDWHCPFSINS